MSIQPSQDLLQSLRMMREKIDHDPTPHPDSLKQLYRLIVHRIEQLEAVQTPRPAVRMSRIKSQIINRLQERSVSAQPLL